jgi:hypothetical protein
MPFRCRLLFILGLICLPLIPHVIQAKGAAVTIKVDKREPFGVSATLGNRVRDNEQDVAITMMREAGVQWAREEIFWDKLQPQEGGPYLWTGDGSGFYNYDASIARLRGGGINVLGLLDYNPAWAKSTNAPLDTWIGAWGDFVYNTVARYGRERGQIKYWEIWNEPNLRRYGFNAGLSTVGDFVRLLNVARAAVKSADPEAIVVLGGITSIWSELPTPQDYDAGTYLRLLYEAGGWGSFDILAIHPYRPGAPEAASWRRDTAQDVEAELRVVDGLLAEFGPKPVWLTEVSWSSYDGPFGVAEEEQAAFLVRMYVLALQHPAVQRIFWYDLRNDSAPSAPYDRPVYNRADPEFNFGLLRRTYPFDPRRGDLRKPAFVAYRTMTQILEDMNTDGVIANGSNPAMPGTFAYRFSGGGRAAIVMWRITGDAAPVVSINCGCRDARVRRWDGKVLGIIQTEGPVSVRLDYIGVPVYVEWGQERATNGQLFPDTGHRVSGPFLNYWNANGGLAQFGFPITEAVVEPEMGSGKQRLVQYFERNRFEYFPEQTNPKYQVQLGRLGDELLRSSGLDWTTLPRAPETPPECLAFPQTGHNICPPFREYWERNGGLSMYGMPLTDAYPEQGLTVQYFERNRFEHHPEKAGTPYEVELGLLGRDLYSRWGGWP